MHLNGVPHCLADVGDGDIGGVHPFGVAMPEGIGGELFALLLGSRPVNTPSPFQLGINSPI